VAWTKFYYANPQPERFVDEVRAIAARGELDKVETRPVIATFLGRVIAANPALASTWFVELADLAGPARETLQVAAWFSQTAEARAWLEREHADARVLGPAPDVLSGPITHPSLLDIAWAYYFATGDVRAVRRVVSALGFMNDVGAAERFKTSAQTAEDRARALNDGIFQAASWSLAALAQEHPPLLAIYEQIVDSDEVDPTERIALAITLQKLAPDRWTVHIDPKAGTARIDRKG
jgi:hypothetical protein